MALRGWIRRLERAGREDLESFELTDGSVYFYDPLESAKVMFMYAYDVQLGDAEKWSEPPEIYQRICEARDPAGVLGQLAPEDPARAFVNVTEIFDRDVLVHERRLEVLPVESPEDLSEP
jgi:hypothetical protein